MTLKKIGSVTITEDKVFVEGFHFEGDSFDGSAMEALKWARGRLIDAVVEHEDALSARRRQHGVKE